jgi:hypothetical protein
MPAIVGKVEFDIDERRARWYTSWKSDAGPRLVDIVQQAVAHARGDQSPSPAPHMRRRASMGQRRLLLEERSSVSPATSPPLRRHATSPRVSPRPLSFAKALSPTQEDSSLVGATGRVQPSSVRGVNGDIDSNEPGSASWPPTPDSPDRLPSATLADRLAPSSPLSAAQDVAYPRRQGRAYVPPPGPALIGFDHDLARRIRPLRDCSEPSPVRGAFRWRDEASMDPWLRRRADLRYPYSLSTLYPSVAGPQPYPPAAASDIIWPLRLALPRVKTEAELYSPISPFRLPSATVVDRLAISLASDIGFARYVPTTASATPWTPERMLVEADWGMQSRQRASDVVSAVTPLFESSLWRQDQAMEPWIVRRDDLRYPWALSCIYPAVDICTSLYPRAAASLIEWPARMSEARCVGHNSSQH